MLDEPPAITPQVSIIIPAFNEAATIKETILRVNSALHDYSLEILVIDDGSTDGTTQLIRELAALGMIRPFFHATNRGKGASLRTALPQVQGEIIVIQDADLEYDPRDIPFLIRPIMAGDADVVYGSRFHGQCQRVHLFWHRVANALVTLCSNVLT